MTISLSSKYRIELYPFESEDPDLSDFKSSVENVLPVSASNVIGDLADSFEKPLVIGNWNRLSYSRSKNNPSSECTFNIIGRIPDGAIPGSWVLIVQESFVDGVTTHNIIKFIGQIHTINTTIMSDSVSGLLTTDTTVSVREWSSALLIPIDYSVETIQKVINERSKHTALNTVFASVAALSSAPGSGYAPKSATDVSIEAMSKQFDPFELAEHILTLVGALSYQDAITLQGKRTEYENLLGVSKFGMSPPGIPPKLLERLGIPGVNASSSVSAYSLGFVKVLFGIQLKQFQDTASGNWNGVFRDYDSINDYKKLLNSGVQAVKGTATRPSISGVFSLASLGKSAWDLLTEHCDNAVNEVYTDMMYYYDGKFPLSVPALFFRDKPFLLNLYKDSSSSSSQSLQKIASVLPNSPSWLESSQHYWDTYSCFDNIPRIGISPESVLTVTSAQTFLNSANYIRANYRTVGGGQGQIPKALSLAAGIIRIDESVKRFGAIPYTKDSLFIPLVDKTNGGVGGGHSSIRYYQNISTLWKYWYSDLHKMPNVLMRIKDEGYPLTVGFNVQTTINGVTIVGHLDSITTNIVVDGDGVAVGDTSLHLSRVVEQHKDGDLIFLRFPLGNIVYANDIISKNTEIALAGGTIKDAISKFMV